jgi:hypothetical protein
MQEKNSLFLGGFIARKEFETILSIASSSNLRRFLIFSRK